MRGAGFSLNNDAREGTGSRPKVHKNGGLCMALKTIFFDLDGHGAAHGSEPIFQNLSEPLAPKLAPLGDAS